MLLSRDVLSEIGLVQAMNLAQVAKNPQILVLRRIESLCCADSLEVRLAEFVPFEGVQIRELQLARLALVSRCRLGRRDDVAEPARGALPAITRIEERADGRAHLSLADFCVFRRGRGNPKGRSNLLEARRGLLLLQWGLVLIFGCHASLGDGILRVLLLHDRRRRRRLRRSSLLSPQLSVLSLLVSKIRVKIFERRGAEEFVPFFPKPVFDHPSGC